MMRRPPVGPTLDSRVACAIASQPSGTKVNGPAQLEKPCKADRARGTKPWARLPSAPVVGFRQREALCQRVIAGQESIGERYLPPPVHAELLPQYVAMGLRRSRRDAQGDAELVVRQALCDQLDHFALPVG